MDCFSSKVFSSVRETVICRDRTMSHCVSNATKIC